MGKRETTPNIIETSKKIIEHLKNNGAESQRMLAKKLMVSESSIRNAVAYLTHADPHIAEYDNGMIFYIQEVKRA
jgi:predicted HTH transcriptional regulator